MPNLNVNKITFQPVNFQGNRHVSQPQFKKAPDTKPDTVEIKEKKEKEEKREKAIKIFILGWIIKAAVTVVGLKLDRNNYINRAQKTFQEVFMRDNITKEETIEMLKRYKEIKKIKDKDQYVQKLFEEVKKNFGFKEGCLELKTFTNAERKDSAGYVQKLRHFVNINRDQENKQIFNDDNLVDLINKTASRFIEELETIENDISKTKVLG